MGDVLIYDYFSLDCLDSFYTTSFCGVCRKFICIHTPKFTKSFSSKLLNVFLQKQLHVLCSIFLHIANDTQRKIKCNNLHYNNARLWDYTLAQINNVNTQIRKD